MKFHIYLLQHAEIIHFASYYTLKAFQEYINLHFLYATYSSILFAFISPVCSFVHLSAVLSAGPLMSFNYIRLYLS